jgi:hypothetical protein
LPDENLNDALEQLEGLAMRTSQGSYVKLEDVKRILEKRKVEGELEEEEKDQNPPPKTFREAKKAIRGNKELMASLGTKGPQEPGRSIAAGPQPSSRT